MGRLGLATVTGDELSHSGHQLSGNLHDRLSPIFEGGFILRHCLRLGLLLVMSKDTPNTLFVPARWKFVLLHFLLLRRR